jgi:hypothetical protein
MRFEILNKAIQQFKARIGIFTTPKWTQRAATQEILDLYFTRKLRDSERNWSRNILRLNLPFPVSVTHTADVRHTCVIIRGSVLINSHFCPTGHRESHSIRFYWSVLRTIILSQPILFLTARGSIKLAHAITTEGTRRTGIKR